jgi:radical SAM protein with 4Fe4S-binding SPASM domain
MGVKEHARRTYEVPEFPDRFHIQTQSYCNADCIFCPYTETANTLSMGKMPWELYQKIIDEAAQHDVQRCALLLMNEPLLDLELPKKIRYAKEKFRPRTEVMITSNGSVLSDRKIGELVDSGLDRIKISIQGLDPQVYEHTMGGLKYDKTVAGVKKLITAVKRSKNRTPRVVLSIVATGSNEMEVRRFKMYWRLHGVKATSVVFENKGGNVKLKGGVLAPKGLTPFKACFRPFRTFYILYNGDVIPCCADWGRKIVLGNVEKQSIREIWHGEPANRLRDAIRTWDMEKLPPICRACSKANSTGAHHANPLKQALNWVKGIFGADRHLTEEEEEMD